MKEDRRRGQPESNHEGQRKKWAARRRPNKPYRDEKKQEEKTHRSKDATGE